MVAAVDFPEPTGQSRHQWVARTRPPPLASRARVTRKSTPEWMDRPGVRPTALPSRGPTGERRHAGRGARASASSSALRVGVGFAGLLGVRVKQALAKKDAVAGERVAAQERVQHKDPSKTAHPVATKWVPRVDLTGTLKPWRDADVGFETAGRLVRVAVATGDRVASGQILAVLDASRAVAQVG